MLSLGTLEARAFSTAYLSLRLDSMSAPPWRTADMIWRESLLKFRERSLSTAPLRAAMFDEWEWPAISGCAGRIEGAAPEVRDLRGCSWVTLRASALSASRTGTRGARPADPPSCV